MQIAHLQRLISRESRGTLGTTRICQNDSCSWLTEWVSSFSIPSRCCFPVVPATSVATLATTLVSRGKKIRPGMGIEYADGRT